MPQIIDAHQHFWQRSRPFDYRWLDAPGNEPISRDFMTDDLLPRLKAAGVDRTVLVQTQHDLDENRWALSLAAKHDFIAGVVGWIDLASPDCEAQLLAFKDQPKFVGVRHITQDEPDDDFIVRPSVLAGLKVLEKHGLPFDLLFYVKHLKHAVTVARHAPELPLVIDHLAKPKIKQQSFDDWRPHLAAAAECPNVFCKLSGMVTEADHANWTVQDLKPYVETALDLFGPSRCMFGSDWPVCELAGSYQQVFDSLKEALGPLSESESAAIFGGTARRFYRLDSADS
ncbi:MAG: amidohydrolase family protein [Planctomycetota bacterium]|nr:amidohydrolase family protein [Planctomycetaceae bacterium]MDQ3331490.1 amidohydrolase family protein [Planctomycetota bacterium]